MKKILPIILILLLSVAGLSACDADASTEPVTEETTISEENIEPTEPAIEENSEFPQYKVVRVVDGDTIVISYNGVDEKVRMIGIDTPESVHPDKTKNSEFGDTVSTFSKSQLSDSYVGIEFDVQERDQYGRLLAYVYVGDKMYNKTLLEEGYASVSTYPPNVKYVDDFTAIQKSARDAGKGMWADGFSANSNSSKNSSASTSSNNNTSNDGVYKAHIKNMKFHTSGCRYGEMISPQNLATFKTRDEAIDAGYAACKVCHP